MKQEDLIKKLENIEVPEIKIQSHQQRLRLALLNSGYFKKKTIMFYAKKSVPVGIALALILVVGISVIQPKLQTVRAMEIAENDPQIQKLMKDYGVKVKQIKLANGKAYALFTLPKEKRLSTELQSSDSIAEIDLKERKVKKLRKIDIPPLTEEEQNRAIEIAKNDSGAQEMTPNLEEREAVVKPIAHQFKLCRKNKGVEVIPANPSEDRRAKVIFKSDEERTIVMVNLTTDQVEEVVSREKGKRKQGN